mgnify:CR=1 FL=1
MRGKAYLIDFHIASVMNVTSKIEIFTDLMIAVTKKSWQELDSHAEIYMYVF